MKCYKFEIKPVSCSALISIKSPIMTKTDIVYTLNAEICVSSVLFNG